MTKIWTRKAKIPINYSKMKRKKSLKDTKLATKLCMFTKQIYPYPMWRLLDFPYLKK